MDVVFNDSEIDKVVERPIELRRVTFLDVLTLLDGPTQHMRLDSRVVETAVPNSVVTILLSTTVSELVSPVLPCRSERLPQPPERYSLGSRVD